MNKKRIVLMVICMVTFMAVTCFAGIKEKRAIQEFQTTDYPALENAIQTAAGYKLPIEVKWDELAQNNYSHLYKEALPKVFFLPVSEAFKTICVDDLGKNALKKALKKIVIINEGGNYGPSAFSFKDGILTIDHEPFSNIDDIASRKKAIVDLLEKSL